MQQLIHSLVATMVMLHAAAPSKDVTPAVQFLQTPLLPSWNVPAGHRVLQSGRPLNPAGHLVGTILVHFDAPARDSKPLGHASQVTLVPSLNVLARHGCLQSNMLP
jgi:hypothetical protein